MPWPGKSASPANFFEAGSTFPRRSPAAAAVVAVVLLGDDPLLLRHPPHHHPSHSVGGDRVAAILLQVLEPVEIPPQAAGGDGGALWVCGEPPQSLSWSSTLLFYKRRDHGMLADDPDSSDIFRHGPKVGRPATPGPMTGPMLGPMLERRLALAWLTVESGIGRSPRATPRRNSTGDRPGSPAQSPAHLPIRPAADFSRTDQSFSSAQRRSP